MVVIKKNGQKMALSSQENGKNQFFRKKRQKKSEKEEIPTKSEPRRVLSNVLIFLTN